MFFLIICPFLKSMYRKYPGSSLTTFLMLSTVFAQIAFLLSFLLFPHPLHCHYFQFLYVKSVLYIFLSPPVLLQSDLYLLQHVTKLKSGLTIEGNKILYCTWLLYATGSFWLKDSLYLPLYMCL